MWVWRGFGVDEARRRAVRSAGAAQALICTPMMPIMYNLGGAILTNEALRIIIMVFLSVSSLVLIASILLQSGNSAGLSGSIGGGAEQLFGKKKSRGYEAILSKVTMVGAVVFILCSLVLVAVAG
jgi:preprotein translocase subunit SecG